MLATIKLFENTALFYNLVEKKIYRNLYLQSDLFSFDPPGFLYQEYRDTSKQQEIEQRRQRENLSSGVLAGTVEDSGGSGVSSPPALQLQLRNSAHSLSLWQNLEAVQASGLLTQLPQKEIIMQEVRNAWRWLAMWTEFSVRIRTCIDKLLRFERQTDSDCWALRLHSWLESINVQLHNDCLSPN